MKPTLAQIRDLHRRNKVYPLELVDIPPQDWPQIPSSMATGSVVLRCMRSRQFLVMEFREPNGARRLSVMRTEYGRDGMPLDGIGWDDLQRLKREAGHGARCAVEIFPPDSEVVNVANMRHLFLCNDPPFMWRRKQDPV